MRNASEKQNDIEMKKNEILIKIINHEACEINVQIMIDWINKCILYSPIANI